jgi:hypothetical protein
MISAGRSQRRMPAPGDAGHLPLRPPHDLTWSTPAAQDGIRLIDDWPERSFRLDLRAALVSTSRLLRLRPPVTFHGDARARFLRDRDGTGPGKFATSRRLTGRRGRVSPAFMPVPGLPRRRLLLLLEDAKIEEDQVFPVTFGGNTVRRRSVCEGWALWGLGPSPARSIRRCR